MTRVARVTTNETCNHRCSFCNARRDHERASVAGVDAVRARIATAADGSELILTGGEPSLRRDLPRLVEHAKASGARRVILETNAIRMAPAELGGDPGLAPRLGAADLDAARVHLPAWGPALAAITGDPTAPQTVPAGMAALSAAGIELEAALSIVAANLDTAAELPEQLSLAGVGVSRLFVRIPLESPDPDALADLDQALRVAEHVADAGKRVGLPVQLDPSPYLPPCLFASPGRVAHLYTLTAGGAERDGYARPSGCEGCVVQDRCPGLAPALRSRRPRPIAEDRLRRRLSIISSPAQQAARELVTREIYRRPDGTSIPAHIVRVNFHCNQSCTFCFVSTHLPAPPEADVLAAIDEVAGLGGVLVLSGGEPTLNPRLAELVQRGKARGAAEVELQTNAILLAEPGRAQALAAAGLDIAFVSLHAATAETSDGITRAPGTFVRTLAGLDRLAEAGVAVRINFVTCGANRGEFEGFVELVAQRWPQAAITVSFVGASTDMVPRTPDLIPRYTDVLSELARGIDKAAERGVEVGGFDSMCGIPLCLVPGDLRPFASLARVPPGYDRGEFLKPAACRECVLEPRCFGIRRGYAQMHGTSELRPVDPHTLR